MEVLMEERIMKPLGTQGDTGRYSWSDARYYYFWALAVNSRNIKEA
jgi:hypothetical protein